MPLGTIDRTPPPFFRQGTSALSKLVLFSAVAICLMAADTRYKLTRPVRAAVATALMPAQQLLQVPVDLMLQGSDYLRGLKSARDAENAARAALARLGERAARTEQLAQENNRLRALLDLRPAVAVRTTPAEVLYVAGDPFSRKLFIDRGERHGIRAGSPVINEAGVLGQVTEVYPLSSVVTLLVDRDASVPVLVARTQMRGAAFGGAEGGTALELRFVSANADVQTGDLLSTSGIDGVYPPGLPVAQVLRVERRSDAGFARILLTPSAATEGLRHLLVLEPVGLQLPPRPEPPAADLSGSAGKKGNPSRSGAAAGSASAPPAAPTAAPPAAMPVAPSASSTGSGGASGAPA